MLRHETNLSRSIAFDIILISFVVALITSPVWFDLNDIIYNLDGLKVYLTRNFVPANSSEFWLLVPIGIIGAWRWTVWLIKKVTATVYEAVEPIVNGKNKEYSNRISFAIITPVYNEDPHIFSDALHSWWGNKPDELIAVIDRSDTECISVFNAFRKDKPSAKLIVTSKPGKRAALVDGILGSCCDIVALVDSDTIWGSHIRDNVLAPFQSDPNIGGVTTRQHPISRGSLWQKMTDVFWDMRNYYDLPAQTAAGRALSCLSGRTSLYRRKILLPKLDVFLNEIIFGRKKESGEDKCLTRLVQEQGWKTYYQSNAVVYSSAASDFRTFWSQRLRWSRNSHNSDFVSLRDGWAWRHPYLAFFMIDRFISTFTLFLGPIFFGIALVDHQWIFATFIVMLWIVGRGIKIIPHIRRHPADLFFLPIYVAVNFLVALTKLYALVTIRDQLVIRGSKGYRKNILSNLKDFLLTGEIILGIILIVSIFH
ncbi:MAG: glycosyltransferase [Thermoproteota archaeon]|nr:glycosyltransferase [Thermoproteota archaeon]